MKRLQSAAIAITLLNISLLQATEQSESSTATVVVETNPTVQQMQEPLAPAAAVESSAVSAVAKHQTAMPQENETSECCECCPEPDHSNRFFITVDALYWKAHEDGLIYAVETHAPNIGQAVDASGTAQEADGKWTWGCRAGLGYRRTDDASCKEDERWSDVYFNWTYFQNNSRSSVSVDNFSIFNSGLSGDWISDSLLGTFNTQVQTFGFGPSASAKWKLTYNTLDAEMGRTYFIGNPFSFRPHFGLRGASINQKLNAQYNSFDTTTSIFVENLYQGKDNFFGVGVRAGVNMSWYFLKNFGAFGNFSGSLVYGKFKVNAQVTEQIPTPAIITAVLATQYNFHTVQPNIDLGIGLFWEVWPDDDCYNLTFAAAYELTEWFNQNRFYMLTSTHVNSAVTTISPLSGNLCLQGLTLKGRFDF